MTPPTVIHAERKIEVKGWHDHSGEEHQCCCACHGCLLWDRGRGGGRSSPLPLLHVPDRPLVLFMRIGGMRMCGASAAAARLLRPLGHESVLQALGDHPDISGVGEGKADDHAKRHHEPETAVPMAASPACPGPS